MNLVRYESVFAITFHAASDVEAKQIALQHHEILRDQLRVEGADHPHDIRLAGLHSEGRNLLHEPHEKSISP
jgi:hypothetical protein